MPGNMGGLQISKKAPYEITSVCILQAIPQFMRRLLLFFGSLILTVSSVRAQSTFLPLDPDIYHWIDRADIRTFGLSGKFHSGFRAFSRESITQLMDTLSLKPGLSASDRFQIRYFREVNSEFSNPDSSGLRTPFLKSFFRRKADILSYQDSVFDIHANIAGYGSMGKSSGGDGDFLINSRGVEVRGTIAKKVGFYSYMADNQVILPDYVGDWTARFGSLPHEGFWKRTGVNGYDFFSARAYITFNAGKHIAFQAGHDRLQTGNGYRSMVLSDFTNPYTFLRISTKIWKIEYTNLFASLKTDVNALATGIPGNRRIPDKLFVFHRLGINLGKRVSLGLFEAVVAGKDPKTSAGGTFPDPSYFNPIIFYRAVEQNSGSPDNASLGFDLKVSVSKSIRAYGQFFLDEFLLKKFTEGNGWWGNKYAFQAGMHYIDVAGIRNLDLQAEFNLARPFTYSHQSNYSSYSHYGQPLAHPLGANFREVLAILRYQPVPRVQASAKLIYFERGLDSSSVSKSFGSDVLKSYYLRAKEDGNFLRQGILQKVLFLDLTLSWQPWTNFFLDIKHVIRSEERFGLNTPLLKSGYTALSVRWNIAQRGYEF